MTTVCLVEDDDSFCGLLQRTLTRCRSIRVSGVHRSGEEALQEVPRRKPDVVLLDIKLPKMDGIECLRRLRKLSPPLLLHGLIVSDYDDERLVLEALRAGASGYLSKDYALSRELPLAIKAVTAGGAVMSPNIARKVIEHFFQTPTSAFSDLSLRELEVLESLSEGLMYKEIAERLSISLNTVRRHVGAIYGKLEVHSRLHATRQYSQWRGR
jgi:DNA-binding NarL/FixJ family response regulator